MATETKGTAVPEPQTAALARQKQTADEEISLLDLLIVLAERRRTVVRVTAAFAVVAIVVSLLLPKKYTATVTLLPPQHRGSSLGAMLGSELGGMGGLASLAGGSMGLKNPNDQYVAMFQSRTVEDAVIQKFGLMKEYHEKLLSRARKKFEDHSKVDGNGKDGLIHISVTDRNPHKAAALANGYVDAFRHLSEHLAISEASQRRVFYDQQLKKAKDQLTNAEEALKETEIKTGMIQVNSQAAALIESAASLRAQIVAKEVEIHALQTFATGENSELVQAQQELAALRTEQASLGGSEENPSSLLVPKGKVPQASLEYVRRLRDVKYYQTIFDILAQQYEVAKLDEAKEGALIQVVDPAIVPDHKSSPKRALIVIAATFAGLFISILIALGRAGMERLEADGETGAKLALLRNELRWRKRKAS
jgi:uncharacterized protein involved in exopolysaccharide biosynthesis